jgi:hypothetical protein
MIESQVALRAGPRIVTVYIYLNDVHGGGGTHFEKLDLTVMPKRGRVVIWPSVYDHDVNEKDWRTMHEALPVEAGIKYGANAWFHLRGKLSFSGRCNSRRALAGKSVFVGWLTLCCCCCCCCLDFKTPSDEGCM